MGYRVAARVVSAAEVGGAHIRELLFTLAHADVQERRGERMHRGGPNGREVQAGLKQNQHADRDATGGGWLDTDVGSDGSGGVNAAAVPLFPPLPDEFEQWGEALRAFPELKPCVHGLDDGVALGLDRSAAAGNGVVPMAAARAFLDLQQELVV